MLAAFAVQASTYYWLVGDLGDNTLGDATDLNNWSIAFDSVTKTPVADAHPTKLPSSADVLCLYRDLVLDLKGQSWTIGNLNNNGKSPYTGADFWGSSAYSFQITNGTLISAGNCYTRITGGIHVWDGGAIICNGYFQPGENIVGPTRMHIHEGGLFQALSYDTIFFAGVINVEEGGTLRLRGATMNSWTTQRSNRVTNRGTTEFTTGISIASGGWETHSSHVRPTLDIVQAAGTMTLGGPVTDNGKYVDFTFTVSGGVVRATADVTFTNGHASVASGSTVTADVAVAAATMDMSDVAFGENVLIVKKGPGSIAFGGEAWPLSLAVEEGYLRFGTDGAACPVTPAFSSGAGILFAATNISLDSVTFPAEGFVCALDLDALDYGDAILVSESETVLAAVKQGVDDWCSVHVPGMRAEAADGAVKLVCYAEYVFDTTSGKTLDDPEGWGGGSMPPADSAVDVTGAGSVNLTPSSPAFSSIRVRPGATLLATGGTASDHIKLPMIELLGESRLSVAQGCYADFTNNLLSSESQGALPVFEVGTNSVVYAPGETFWKENGSVASNEIRFMDIDMRVFGQICTPTATTGIVNMYLGTSPAWKVSRFAFTGIGGSIFLKNYCWGYNHGYLRIANPGPGGRVKVESPIVFRNFSFPVFYGPDNRSYNSVMAGINNPTSETVVIEANNTVFDVTDTSEISGGVDFRLSNGATFKRQQSYLLNTVTFKVTGRGKVTFEDTGFVYGRTNPNPKPEYYCKVSPDEDGLEALTFRNASFMPWFFTGNGKGVITLDGATWYLGDFLPYSPNTYDQDHPPSPLFDGFKEARIADGKTFALAGTNYAWGSNISVLGRKMEWDRTIDFAHTVPITGGGNLLVSNTAPTNTMTATVFCGSNTCTGAAGAEAGTRSTLLFADGANWAGTVVANGCVSLTGATDASAPATVTFGAIQLDGEFPVRIWKNGGVETNDVVNITGTCAGIGRIVGMPMDGYVPQLGDTFTLGTYPANVELPPERGKWSVVAVATSDPEKFLLKLRYAPKGTIVSCL